MENFSMIQIYYLYNIQDYTYTFWETIQIHSYNYMIRI